MTSEHRSEILMRSSAATAGPWEHGHHWDASEWVPQGKGGRKFRPTSDTSHEWVPSASDAIFIAHARTDIPYLLDLVARIETLAENAKTVHGRLALRDEVIKILKDTK